MALLLCEAGFGFVLVVPAPIVLAVRVFTSDAAKKGCLQSRAGLSPFFSNNPWSGFGVGFVGEIFVL